MGKREKSPLQAALSNLPMHPRLTQFSQYGREVQDARMKWFKDAYY